MADGTGQQQNATAERAFTWSGTSASAVVLVAEDVLSDEAIAERLGINRTTLYRWKKHPEFSARANEIVAELQEQARRKGLARLDQRMIRYEKRAKELDIIVEERAEDMADVPGGRSGWLVRQYKSIGTGPNARQVEEYHFDAALHREMSNLEKQVAQDTGQWSEKREISGPEGGAIVITAIEVPGPLTKVDT